MSSSMSALEVFHALRPAYTPGEDRNTIAGANTINNTGGSCAPAYAPGEDRNAHVSAEYEPRLAEAAPGVRAGRGSQRP